MTSVRLNKTHRRLITGHINFILFDRDAHETVLKHLHNFFVEAEKEILSVQDDMKILQKYGHVSKVESIYNRNGITISLGEKEFVVSPEKTVKRPDLVAGLWIVSGPVDPKDFNFAYGERYAYGDFFSSDREIKLPFADKELLFHESCLRMHDNHLERYFVTSSGATYFGGNAYDEYIKAQTANYRLVHNHIDLMMSALKVIRAAKSYQQIVDVFPFMEDLKGEIMGSNLPAVIEVDDEDKARICEAMKRVGSDSILCAA